MDDKLPKWVYLGLIVLSTIILIVGAIKTLAIPGTPSLNTAFGNCVPGGLILSVYIILKVFASHDLSTLIVFISLFLSVMIFYLGFTHKDKDTKANLIALATTIIGFATGIPIGGQLEKKNVQNTNTNT